MKACRMVVSFALTNGTYHPGHSASLSLLADHVKEIPLSKGKVALVDDEDFEMLMHRRWYFSLGYARNDVKIDGKRVVLRMHRLVMGASKGQYVDHIDGDTLNNQKSNLRFCTLAQNRMNSRKSTLNSCGLKGVSYSYGKWVAHIGVDRKTMAIGRFSTKEEAHEAYKA